MTAILNRWQGIGNLTADPQQITSSEYRMAVFRVACDRAFQSSDGLEADFIPVVVKGDQAENAMKYLRKGRLIYIEGRLSVRPYNDDSQQTRWVLEIDCDYFRMLDSPSKSTQRDSQYADQHPPAAMHLGNTSSTNGRSRRSRFHRNDDQVSSTSMNRIVGSPSTRRTTPQTPEQMRQRDFRGQ